MTLLCVVDNVVYVDSYQSFGNAEQFVDKRRSYKGHTFSLAGDVHRGLAAAIAFIDGRPVQEFANDPDHTSIVIRNPEGALICLELGLPQAAALDVAMIQPEGGLQYQCGTGWPMFQAFFLEHACVRTAFELTAKFCPTVGGAVNTF